MESFGLLIQLRCVTENITGAGHGSIEMEAAQWLSLETSLLAESLAPAGIRHCLSFLFFSLPFLSPLFHFTAFFWNSISLCVPGRPGIHVFLPYLLYSRDYRHEPLCLLTRNQSLNRQVIVLLRKCQYDSNIVSCSAVRGILAKTGTSQPLVRYFFF